MNKANLAFTDEAWQTYEP